MSTAPGKNSVRSLPEKFRRLAFLLFFLALGTAEGFAQRPLGTDVSHYQGSINWTPVKNAGVTFAWAKATEATYYTDPTFTANETGARGAGIYIGAYHFARPSANPNITGPNSADSEAAYFWSVAGNYIQGRGRLPGADAGLGRSLRYKRLQWVECFHHFVYVGMGQ